MANTKSAKKRIRKTKKLELYNKSIKSELKTIKRKFLAKLEENKKEEAEKLFLLAEKKYRRAASKGVIHKNTASRHISRMKTKLNLKSA